MIQSGDSPAHPALDEPVVCPAFVGRDRQLQALRDLAAEAARGRGQTVLVAGEAGIGKSRLVAEFHDRIRDTPHIWMESAGEQGSFSKHYGTAAGSLLEAEVVTADGQIRIANACTNADLFWAWPSQTR